MTSFFDLDRFLTAQEPVYPSVLSELCCGQKRTHWMWFVFPQLRGLGLSATAQFYGIASLDEAAAFWAHPILGTRLKESVELVNQHAGKSAIEIFGFPDDLKFRSCLTLFKVVAADEASFEMGLSQFYAGEADQATLRLLGASPSQK